MENIKNISTLTFWILFILIISISYNYAEELSIEISKDLNVEIFEDHETEPVAFTVNHSDFLTTTIAISVSSSNTKLVKDDNITIVFNEPYTSGYLTVNPEKNCFGIADITLTAIENENISKTAMFSLTVNSVNDQPSFLPFKNQIIQALSNGEPQIITKWAQDMSPGVNEYNQKISFQVNCDSPELFYSIPIITKEGDLIFTPAFDVKGDAVINVYLEDDGGIENGGIDKSEAIEFIICLIPEVKPPAFFVKSELNVLEDCGFQSVLDWVSITRVETTESIIFDLNIENETIFSTLPEISNKGVLSFEPYSDTYGIAIVNVLMKVDDYISNPQAFTINIIPVNDPPEFLPGGNLYELEDSGHGMYAWANRIKAGPLNEADQQVYFHIINIDNPNIFSEFPVISSDGVISYTLAENEFGTATIEIALKDNGGIENGGIDSSNSYSFKFRVQPVNDCPVFQSRDEIIVENRSGEQVIKNWITNFHAGFNENDQKIIFFTKTDNEDIFINKPVISENGDLIFEPDPYTTGVAFVEVQLTDDGGVENYGCDTAIKTFNISIEPTFYTLNIMVEGNGIVLVNGNKNVNFPLKEQYLADEIVSIEALNYTDWTFSYWSGDINDSSKSVDILMDNNKTIIAYYTGNPYQLDLRGNGWILINDLSYKLPCKQEIDRDINVVLKPIGNFSYWSGDLEGNSNPALVNMNRNKIIYANYKDIHLWENSILIQNMNYKNDDQIDSTDEISIGVMDEAYTSTYINNNKGYSCMISILSKEKKLANDIRKNGKKNYSWIIAVDPHGNIGDPMNESASIISWDVKMFSLEGTYKLILGTDETGEILIEDMREINEYEVKGKNYFQYFTIIWLWDSKIYHLNKVWNLISIPVLPDDLSLNSIFPDAEVAYVYEDGSYNIVEQLKPITGYWINMSSGGYYEVKGQLIPEIKIHLTKGWNLIGAHFEPHKSITVIYGFEHGSYKEVSCMESGYGYWVNVNEDIEINIKE